MRSTLAAALLATPMALFLLAFFYAPLVYVAVYSVEAGEGVLLSAYLEVLTRPEYYGVIASSAVNAMVVAIVSTALAAPAAYYVASLASPRLRPLLLVVLVAPFWVDVLLRALSLKAILYLLGVREGYLAMMLGLVYEYLPISIITGYVAFTGAPPRLVEAARTLGATPLQAFVSVVLPLSAPWLVAGSVIVFLMALTDYVVPGLLGGTQGFTVGTLLYHLILSGDRWDLGSAVTSLLTVATVAGTALAFKRVYEVAARA